MIGLPAFGDTVKIYPRPGMKVQATEAPVDRWAGGHWLAPEGEDVVWSAFQHEQLKHGAIMFHPPISEEAETKRAAKKSEVPKKFDHAAATAAHMETLAEDEEKPAPAAAMTPLTRNENRLLDEMTVKPTAPAPTADSSKGGI